MSDVRHPSSEGRSLRPNALRPVVRLALALALGASAAGLAGCASTSGAAKKALNPDPPGRMYATADSFLQQRDFKAAAQKFEELDRDHPYAPEARRAVVMAAWAYYKDGKYPEAIASARRYTTMHPGTKEAALAHHIIASSYFDDINDPARDQTATRKALKELRILQQRYPQSRYAKETANRIRIAEDILAASEMNVGRYYLKRKNYLAAINRFKTVVQRYQTTKHVEEALMRLTEAYMALGIRKEAQTAAAVLGHNFPQSPWYRDAYQLLASDGLAPRENRGSWISRTWRAAVKAVSLN
ncbi:MAG: outer membrane protein assembly factor BamD [Pseudomonadota bacterium]